MSTEQSARETLSHVDAAWLRMDSPTNAMMITSLVGFDGLGVLAALGVGSLEIERIALDIFTREATAMLTNVPGPTAPVVLAGQTVGRIVVWAPTSGHLGLGLSLLSYAGEARLGGRGRTFRVHPWCDAVHPCLAR